MAEPLWTPTAAAVEASNLTAFTHLAREATGRELPDYAALHDWSVHESGEFWRTLWQYCDVVASAPASEPVTNGGAFPGARWFEDARLNYAENLLRWDDDHPAIVSYLETGERRELSYRELRSEVAALAASLDIAPGDRVAGWLPNVPEAATAMLATTAKGGVWSSCSPDFGVEGALDRFGQIEPRVLFACDGYTYNGKTLDVRDKVRSVAAAVPSIEQIIWVSVLGLEVDGITYESLSTRRDEPLTFVQMPFNAPLYILYSSGTTGKPKCIVHGAGGTLLQHLKEHQLHTGLTRSDRLFFFTTCGWMMWNWLISALATGCTLVLYDGSPFHPKPGTLWDMADQEALTVFGISARYLNGIEKADVRPRVSHELAALRTLISTGSPLTHEGFSYVYESVKPDVHLVSMSGGTDIISCFVLGNPNAPVYEGEIQCAGLGMAVDVWNDAGQSVTQEKGELVCTAPFPSCPIGFWRDEGDARFAAAYFEQFPGVWAHGDFAELTEHGGFVIHGRSDAVLNPGGVRIGTAEIYRQVESIEAIVEAVCVGQEWDGDTRVVLFLLMREGAALDAALEAELRSRIRQHASPRHVPGVILTVPDIPRTMSGKIAELAVRDTIHGREVRNTTALANPEALSHFRNRPELA